MENWAQHQNQPPNWERLPNWEVIIQTDPRPSIHSRMPIYLKNTRLYSQLVCSYMTSS